MDPLSRRKSLRLKEYDYSQNGAYFVTVCTKNRIPLLGRIVGAGPRPARCELSPYGKIVQEVWEDLPNHTRGIVLDQFMIMPDHIHAMIILDDGRAGLGPAPTAIPEVVRQLKSFSSRKINLLRGTPGMTVWQRSYFDHGVRNYRDYLDCVEYIAQNPARWLEKAPPAR